MLKFIAMKRNTITIGLFFILGLAMWNCTDADLDNATDKTTQKELNAQAKNLSIAVKQISQSKGFEIITLKGKTKTAKTDDGTTLKIAIDNVKGEYAFQKQSRKLGNGLFSDFKKTKDTSLFIIKMPKDIIHKPWSVRENKTTEEIENNFEVITKKYLYEITGTPMKLNYNLESSFKLDNTNAGSLIINWAMEDKMNAVYDSQYKFDEEYMVGTNLKFGQTTVCEYYLNQGDKTLYKEKCKFSLHSNTDDDNFEYNLSIQNIEIKFSGDKYVIFRDGKEEKDANIEVIMNMNGDDKNTRDSRNESIMLCMSSLDLKITFSDKTEIILSELIGKDTLSKMKEIFDSMYDMYFVKHIIDRVATQVYYMNMEVN